MRPLNEGTGQVELVTIDRHLYLTEDGARVVPEGHPDARWLWASPGDERPRNEAERVGAASPAKTEEAEHADKDEAGKAAEAPEDKRRTRPADKGR